MSKLKWIMKQYWRIGTIRALLSLALGMFVLGRWYYVYVPYLQDMGLIGALTLGTSLVLVFLGIGWLYDERVKMWAPGKQAAVERNPYSYVPNPRAYAIDFPMAYATIATLKGLFEKMQLDKRVIENSTAYLADYFRRAPLKEDIESADSKAQSFKQQHPFLGEADSDRVGIGIGARVKLGFQIHTLRLTWIQSLTGLAQDVLVFGAFYITVLVPGAQVGETVALEYLIMGIAFISAPLFIVLALLGWYYDKRLKVWSPERAVIVERDPFSYVPDPRYHAFDQPALYPLFSTLREVAVNADLDISELDKIIDYVAKYTSLSVSREEDMQVARDLQKSYGAMFQKKSTR
ncbi:MAG: hypothetical protein ACFE8Z_08805 [Candidatus Hermodarchaeota archaeon]